MDTLVDSNVEELPSLLVQVTGTVVSTNLEDFTARGRAMIAQINTDPKTDEEFEIAGKVVTRCKKAEELIDTVTAQALAQMTSIDDLLKAMASLKSEFASTRLALARKVTENKDAGKQKIIGDGQFALMEHIAMLNKRLGSQLVKLDDPSRFQNAVKGLSSFANMRTRVSATLDAAKIEASEIADRIEFNRQSLSGAEDWTFLFPDFASVCMKAPDDFASLLAARIFQEQTRRDVLAEHARKEDAARAEREAARVAALDASKPAGDVIPSQAVSNDQRGKTEEATHAQPKATAAPQAPYASTPPLSDGLDAVLRDNARMLFDTLLEVRTLVKPGGRAHTLIDEACAKVGVIP